MKRSISRIAGSITLVGFLTFCVLVYFFPSTLTSYDQGLFHAVRRLSPAMDPYFLGVTKLANPLTVSVLSVFLFAVFYFKQRITAYWFLLSMGLISGVGNHLLKLLFQRERPTYIAHMVSENSFSFPSGHATASTLLYGTLLVFFSVFVKNKGLRTLLQFLMVLIILSVVSSRVYLGVHYPSDVSAGVLFASSWLLFTYPTYRRRIKLETSIGENNDLSI